MQPVPLLDTVAWVCQLLQLSLLLPWYFLCMSQIGDIAGVWNAAAAAANAQRNGYGSGCINHVDARNDQNDDPPDNTRCFTFADMDTAMQMRAICGGIAVIFSSLLLMYNSCRRCWLKNCLSCCGKQGDYCHHCLSIFMSVFVFMLLVIVAGASTISPLRSDDDDENKWGGGTPAKGLPIVALVITGFLIVVHLLKQVGCKKPCSERFPIYEEADGDDALLDGTLQPTLPTQSGAVNHSLN